MQDYDFSKIEEKWQSHWEANETYKVSHKSEKPKYYVLDMFPYPSGAGLHVGHPLGYIASDIYSRYKRLKGFNVLHPMGFDAFGLPAEQYAVRTGQHPEITTQNNIATYKSQLRKLGFCYDWSREVSTCDPSYYKWTQWIFIQLFNSWYNTSTNKAEGIETAISHLNANGTKGLNPGGVEEMPSVSAEDWKGMNEKDQQDLLMQIRLCYLSFTTVNWCPALGTVLANDEVKEGLSERGGHPVEKKKMRQWSLRTTAYSQRLLDGLETLDWSDSMKEMQRNWIGRSEGSSVWFDIEGGDKKFEVFTTRPDTIYGVTFMVLAPEHELIKEITTPEQQAAVDEYVAYVGARSDIERQQEKKVTGAFTGAYAKHPLTGDKVPIWISEYVLIGYGTGAIMAVPSDDDRDETFATTFDIPIIDIIDKSKYPNATNKDKLGIMINSDFVNGMEVPDAIRAVIDRLEEMGIGTGKINYRLRDAGYSRQRYWGEPFPIVYKDGIATTIPESELPLVLPQIDNYKPSGTGESPIANAPEWVNSPEGKRETDTMPGYAGSSWYFLRYMDPKNDDAFVGSDAESYWGNVDLYIGGSEHAVGHLIYSRIWHKFFYDRGFVGTEEPFKKMVNQGMIQGRSNFIYRKKGTNTFVSAGLIDQYETTKLNVSIDLVKDDVLDTEAFKNSFPEYNDADFILEEGVYNCTYEIEKMSKSKYNVVNPDSIVEQYGADCLRMFEMFLGPLEDSKPWITKGIGGVQKFQRKLWNLFQFDENGQANLSDEAPSKEELKVLHTAIKKITFDIERLSFNTCISAFMICVNDLQALKNKLQKREIVKDLIILLAPFAPYATEELWNRLGETGSIHATNYPEHNEEYLTESAHTYPVQINKKVRAQVSLPVGISKDDAQAAVLANEKVMEYMADKEIVKFIFVPKKIISLVVKG